MNAILLHWVMPIVIQTLTPFVLQAVKVAVAYLKAKLPDSVIVVLAGAIGEGLNQAQMQMTGAQLPPGAAGFIAILTNEIITDLSGREQIPTIIPRPDNGVLGAKD